MVRVHDGSQLPGQRSGFSWLQVRDGAGLTQTSFFEHLGSLARPQRVGP